MYICKKRATNDTKQQTLDGQFDTQVLNHWRCLVLLFLPGATNKILSTKMLVKKKKIYSMRADNSNQVFSVVVNFFSYFNVVFFFLTLFSFRMFFCDVREHTWRNQHQCMLFFFCLVIICSFQCCCLFYAFFLRFAFYFVSAFSYDKISVIVNQPFAVLFDRYLCVDAV